MIISKNSFDCYNEIKHLKNISKLDLEDYLKLNQIYSEITGKPISKGCVNCVLQAWLIVNNWVEKFYEVTELTYKTKEILKEVAKRKRKPKA